MSKKFNLPKLNINSNKYITYPANVEIVNKLKHMNNEDVNEVFKLFTKHKLTNLQYYNVFTVNNRPIIYVSSITVNKEIIPINMGFYKSTGTSRNTGLKNIWLPTPSISIFGDINKLEDRYLSRYESYTGTRDLTEEHKLLKFMRFVEEKYALTSWFLSHYPNLTVTPVIESSNLFSLLKEHVVNISSIVQEETITLNGQK